MSARKLKLDAFLPFRLSVASNLVSDVIADSYKSLFGLKIPEWRALALIGETDGITQLEVASRSRLDKVTVSRATIALSARGLVARKQHPSDGRSQLLTLTPAGRDLYSKIVPEALALERQIFAGIAESELQNFIKTLNKIQRASLDLLQHTPLD
jgi:DNA-binding MarR family transcriptional regulator